jgi:ribonuclease Z
MQPFELTILGCSSATPTSKRNPTSQLLNIHDKYFLIDCGEATQIQLRKFKLKFQRISHIFISHLHGDHYFGLMGLLSSMHLLGRKNELHLYCPAGLKEIVELQNKYSQTYLNYHIEFHLLGEGKNEIIYEDEKVSVATIPLNHRIPCNGFLFREKVRQRNIIKEKIEEYKIPKSTIKSIKAGADYITENGQIISNSELTAATVQPRSYAFCSDTCYDESIVPIIKNVDLLYHETTFMDDMKVRAKETFHSTTLQAGKIAKLAGVKQLLIGHFSARYNDLDLFLDEVKPIFENTLLALEGEVIKVS